MALHPTKSSSSPIILVILSLLIISINADNSCSWTDTNTGKFFDFSALNRPGGWKVTDISTEKDKSLFSIDFLFNFCSQVPNSCNDKSKIAVMEALEVTGQITDACEVLGTLDQMATSLGTSLGAPGVKITYKGGEECLNSENPSQNGLPKQATFNIICSENTDSQFQQVPFNGQSITKCSPEFYINHPLACAGLKPSRGYTTTLIAIVLMVYIIGGTAYNIKVQNRKGVEAFPNINFWRKAGENLKYLPGYAKGVASKISNKLRGGQLSGFTNSTGPRSAGPNGSRSAQYTVL